MSVTLNGREDLVRPAARIARTAIDTGDGGTPEQRALLELLVERIWFLDDTDIDALAPISTSEVAELFDDEVAARRLRQILVLFEALRAPQTREQVELVDGFAVALGGDDEGLSLIRDSMRDETERAAEHLRSKWGFHRIELSESDLVQRHSAIDEAIEDPELATRLRSLRDLPRGTLGREYIEFYLRNEFEIPGDGGVNPAFFVQHDMSHLLAGLDPTPQGELALSAFQVGMFENEAHWTQFLVGLAAFELGILGSATFDPTEKVLAREGAMELVLESFDRGTRCVENYNDIALLKFADRPIVELRGRFGIEPPGTPFPDHIDIAD